MEKWTELRTAYHDAKHGTVSAVSRALGAHRATVNCHIDALEQELGARIFIRNPKGYTLIEYGEALLGSGPINLGELVGMNLIGYEARKRRKCGSISILSRRCRWPKRPNRLHFWVRILSVGKPPGNFESG